MYFWCVYAICACMWARQRLLNEQPVKQGKLVLEKYAPEKGITAKTPLFSASTCKTISSTFLGLRIADGAIKLTDLVQAPGWDDAEVRRRNITSSPLWLIAVIPLRPLYPLLILHPHFLRNCNCKHGLCLGPNSPQSLTSIGSTALEPTSLLCGGFVQSSLHCSCIKTVTQFDANSSRKAIWSWPYSSMHTEVHSWGFLLEALLSGLRKFGRSVRQQHTYSSHLYKPSVASFQGQRVASGPPRPFLFSIVCPEYA